VFIRLFQASSEALEGVGIFKSSGGFIAFDWWTSSKIYSSRSHTEPW
jgi:hypothetical protein